MVSAENETSELLPIHQMTFRAADRVMSNFRAGYTFQHRLHWEGLLLVCSDVSCCKVLIFSLEVGSNSFGVRLEFLEGSEICSCHNPQILIAICDKQYLEVQEHDVIGHMTNHFHVNISRSVKYNIKHAQQIPSIALTKYNIIATWQSPTMLHSPRPKNWQGWDESYVSLNDDLHQSSLWPCHNSLELHCWSRHR